MKIIDGLSKSEYVAGGLVESPIGESLSNTESKEALIPLDVYDAWVKNNKGGSTHTRIDGKDLLALIDRRKSIPNWRYGKNDVTNVICNWLILHGYTKKTPYDYNARVLLCAFEIVRNRERLSVEGFRFVIENLPDVDINSLEMLDKSRVLYKKFCGVMDGEVVMVEDFVKELFA